MVNHAATVATATLTAHRARCDFEGRLNDLIDAELGAVIDGFPFPKSVEVYLCRDGSGADLSGRRVRYYYIDTAAIACAVTDALVRDGLIP